MPCRPTNPATSLEALLRNTCRRALCLGVSFIDQLRLYRSIVALAREVRLRSNGIVLEMGDALSALLAEVCEHASELGLDPDLPLPDTLRVQRLVVQLSRAARLVGATAPAGRRFFAQHPMHREEADADDRLSAWRNDHTTERDRRAHEKLRTVIDERVISKINARNKRYREEREAAQRAAAAGACGFRVRDTRQRLG